MSAVRWRAVLTMPEYTNVAAASLRRSLVEAERVKAEKRAAIVVKKQTWTNGTPSESAFVTSKIGSLSADTSAKV